MSTDTLKVAIVGGGITGLTTAYYLQKTIREQGLPIEYVLLEASDRLGGKIQTDYTNGFVIERGPDSFLARKTSASRLVKEVGLEDKLVRNYTGQAYVLNNDKLYPIPGGAIMGIPTKLTPFITTSLFSPAGKLRAALDLVLPRSPQHDNDRSLGEFFRHRLGDEVVENLIEPLLSGIYAGDIDQLSLMSTFPQFHQVEQKYRSLILGMRSTTPKQPKSAGNKKAPSAFLTLTTGLQSLVAAIEKNLDPACVRKHAPVQKVTKTGQGYKLYIGDGSAVYADSVVVTTPPQATLRMFTEYECMRLLADIPTTSVATIALAFPKAAIKQNIDGTGFVVSRNAHYTITACTWTHKKWPHTTPEGKALLRCYVGRAGDDSIVYKSDEEIIRAVLHDLRRILEINETPEFYHITRWKQAMPQYIVGHKYRIEKLSDELKRHLPGIFLAGAPYYGIGLPDCIDQGEAAVKQVLRHLRTPILV
ncbi:protoporphyrinogen oxidase [Aneurinibacillus thermoaerophilus]|uniref:Coproporphyrinogen III oxidase n=1 Tax=Aneurinibacillus thermoaerophilus TaxID=143495 RepID=A0ABX8YGL7_ANETH|nr:MULTISPECIES: protoporphyrinogen oxidase [Aneurinibacillus]AMA74615.1 protoporphyrinogen oxidase [Aneurinibacillus sp. XH2]MED0674883.1 protoporphyrinogen oxidase [Aneurinibacillus thermoaerophilus]MED0758465.1 protoporphyrinogen oxidase [Aneurinibacillus thermoaerophilus]MED0762179.1 protoporphyrinogen oxidase [Aneurinibacillus thermoaerophilus]QYY44632.1 protoporphyrinogen oxidase [Aneurinibacillus thermoaerophilus]